MTRDNELALIEAWQKHRDRAARDQIVRAMQSAVRVNARKYARPGLELDDLTSEGNIGLLRALERFDPNRGTRFITYSVYWIRDAIQKFIERESMPADCFEIDVNDEPLVDTSTSADAALLVSESAAQIRVALAALTPRERGVIEAIYGIDREQATHQEIANELGVSRVRVTQLATEIRLKLQAAMSAARKEVE